MVRTDELVQTVVISVAFLGILLGIGFIQGIESFHVEFSDSVLVVIALIPFLFFLAVTGRLQRFTGGGFEIVLQEQARKFVSPNATEKIEVAPELLNPKTGLAELEEISRRSPTVLTFELEREHFYDTDAIREFLEHLETLRYIVFTERDGRFKGYSTVSEFLHLMESRLVDVVEELESGNILDHATVRTVSTQSDSTNVECLRTMDEHDIDELAVVNSEGRFTGVITQNAIIRKLMSSAISEI